MCSKGEAEEAGHHLRQTPPLLGAPLPGGARHGSDGASLAADRNATGLQSLGERKVVDIWGKAAIGKINSIFKMCDNFVC